MFDEKTVLHLFDSYWFEYGVITANSPSSAHETSPILEVQQQQEEGKEEGEELVKLKSIKTLMRKSLSDQILSSKDCPDDSGSPSPNSVLMPHTLQTILSSKELDEFQESTPRKQEYLNINDIGNGLESSTDGSSVCISRRVQQSHYSDEKKRHYYGRSSTEGKKKKKNSSKSLSELELEELKGFMDLGFVFSDEDRERLVSIIPGLQRLGNESDHKGLTDHVSVSRPYLSEAWDALEDENRVNNSLMDWRIPAFGDEKELKNHLKSWAHTVASTIRC